MGHDWILDVLTDLKTFARANDMRALATHLEGAAFVAQIELASRGEGNGRGICGETAIGGGPYSSAGVRNRA